MTAGDECTVLELMELMEKRGIEGVQEISDRYGGVEGLCQRLRTSINDVLLAWWAAARNPTIAFLLDVYVGDMPIQ
ncbi:hypothetical protein D918_09679 [Trichuris suis]|nr:hypothetical protein D918_09679 [Trichuris suis]